MSIIRTYVRGENGVHLVCMYINIMVQRIEAGYSVHRGKTQSASKIPTEASKGIYIGILYLKSTPSVTCRT